MSDSSAVQTTIDKMTSSFARQDMAGVLSTYEDNAIVMGQPGMPVQGTPALREMFKGFFALNPKFTFTAHDTIVSGDIAVHFSTWKMEGAMPDGTKIQDGGLSVAVLRKQPDGKWLMVIDNPSGDHLLKSK